LFAQTRKPLLNRLIHYEKAPSHDTFSRVLRFVDPEAFARSFERFAKAFHQAMSVMYGGKRGPGQVIAIDGKTLRRAYEKGRAASPPMMVSAFAANSRLCVGAGRVKPGENEIMAALEVVELLDLTGKIITADALHCTMSMARTITAKGGDYVLALKGNRRSWLGQAKRCFMSRPVQSFETQTRDHGRDQLYCSEIVRAPEPVIDGHIAFGRITCIRPNAKVVTRYFMTSLNLAPAQLLTIVRQHWSIENNLHWVLDVHLGEDNSRARKDNAPANTGIINRIARNILQLIDKPKTPISHRIKKCAWNDDYLLNAITHMR
jgi:predicted transposase YbfD/YdcC